MPKSVSPDDLMWWLTLAPTLRWTFAKTYADSAPHDYIVAGRTAGITPDEFRRAAHVIHTFGEPGRFWRSTNIYLTHPGIPHRWWTMDADLDDTDLINRAVNDRVYGLQDAPRTFSGGWAEYDAIGTRYDAQRAPEPDFDAALREQIADAFPGPPPRVLDIGCGTGRALDLGITTPDRYTGIDPSQAMLNALVRKHPATRRLIPARWEDVPMSLLAPGYDLVLAVDVPLTAADRERVAMIPAALTLIV
ncbi:methyltransferase [Microbacterium sp. AZCO]|uniref:methyltransferase n=1 Tax=Microbacterium sp. AZCO TaxID=3142976 RepID=UPI0031F3ACBF